MKKIKVLITILSILLISSIAFSGQVLVYPVFKVLDDDGNALSGGLVYFYEPGTTTAKAAYTDVTLDTEASNPTTLDSRGEALIYLDGLYKINVTESDGTQVTAFPVDNFGGAGASILDLTLLSDYASFAAAISAISTTETTLYIDTDGSVAVDTTVPATCDLVFLQGNILTIATTKTLTIKGNIDPGLFQKFDVSAASSTVAFTSNKVISWVYPEWWGANGDGTTDDETYIDAVLTTGVNVKLTSPLGYYIDDSITFSTTTGQILSGTGQQYAGLLIDASFDTTEDGVIELGANQQTVKDLKIVCDQVDTATRTSMTAFPDIIYAPAREYTKIQNVRIEEAYDGIDITGAVKGVLVDNLEMSFFNRGIQVNGATEDVKLHRMKLGDVGSLSANQQTLLAADDTYGIYVTQANALTITDSHFEVGQPIDFVTGSTIRAQIKGCTFLNENGILMASGVVSVTGSDFIGDGTGEQMIEQSAGQLTLDSCTFDINADMTDPMIDVTGGTFIAKGSIFDTGSNDMQTVYGTGSGSTIILQGNHFLKTTNTSYSDKAIYVVSSAILVAENNFMTAAGTGDGDAIAVDTDSTHIIKNNHFAGYDIDLPTSPENMSVWGNVLLSASDHDQENLVGPVKYKVFTGTLAADGTATIAHSLTFGSQYVIGWYAVYRSGANTMAMMDDGEITVDNTNINVAGTAAALDSAKYRILIFVGGYADDWS